MIQPKQLKDLLSRIRDTSLGVVGDFCLDAYWQLDEGAPELSLETGKPTFSVTHQSYSLGGAGNVVTNLAAIGVSHPVSFGVYGNDMFGAAMLQLMAGVELNCDGMVLQSKTWQTAVYAKPYRGAEEQNRIDFGRSNILSRESEKALIERISHSVGALDGLIINQQLPKSILTPAVVEFLNALPAEYPGKTFLLDARERIPDFRSMICKLNAVETARLFGRTIARNESATAEELAEYAKRLFEQTHKPVYITRSRKGILLFDGISVTEFPAVEIHDPFDPVGAGDTVVAALGAALASRSTLSEAAVLATAAAAVTAKKLRQTGTARPEEILSIVESAPFHR